MEMKKLLRAVLFVIVWLAVCLFCVHKGYAQAPLQVNAFPTVKGRCGATITTIPPTDCTGSNSTTGAGVQPDLTGASGPVLTSGTYTGKYEIMVHGSYGIEAFAVDPVTGAQTRIPNSALAGCS